MDQALIEGLKAKHGSKLRVITITNEDGDKEEFVAKMPSRAEFKRFVALLSDDDTKADAFESISISCVVHPEHFEGMLEDRPGLAMTLGGKVAELAGVLKRSESRKA
jgi:hypothetical protein